MNAAAGTAARSPSVRGATATWTRSISPSVAQASSNAGPPSTSTDRICRAASQRKTSVNDREGLGDAYLTSSGLSPWDDDCLLRAKNSGLNLRTWGDGYGYVLVATGRVEAMFDPKAELYDLAPMPIILSEAGGRFTDLRGDVTPDGGSGLATNGKIHDELLAVLNG